MIIIYRYIKKFAKLTATIIVIFVILTYQNSHVLKSRIKNFHIWREASKREVTKPKFILLWSKQDHNFDVLLNSSISDECVYNCYFTKDKNFIQGFKHFDAILFSEKVSSHFDVEEELPSKRFLNQTFVFVGRESAENYAVCEEEFDDYFNLTWTYKLDSDVVWPYFTVFNKKGEEIAPSLDVNWTTKVKPISAKIGKAIVNVKKYPVVWMVSNCYTQSRRETYFNELKVALQWYGFEIHVIGSCGTRQCPFEKDKECIKKLKQYYFYLALENSISEDYVTEKALKALLHYTVPVVFGGANYSRFLPPDSYINGRDLGPKKTAEKMAKLIINQTEYLHYFSWQNHYIIRNKTDTICKLCEALYKGVGKVHNNFRKWWNPNYKKNCEAQEAASKKTGEIPRVPLSKIEKFTNYVNSDIQVKKTLFSVNKIRYLSD